MSQHRGNDLVSNNLDGTTSPSNPQSSPSATTKSLEDTLLWLAGQGRINRIPEALAAIDNYTKEAVIKELEKLLKKQYFAEGYGYDHGQVVDVFDIEDAIKSLKGGIDD